MKRSMADFHSSSNASEPGLSTPILKLTQTEEVLFQKILDACDKLGLKTAVRVAGGWVRDKLLVSACGDVDAGFVVLISLHSLRDYPLMISTSHSTI